MVNDKQKTKQQLIDELATLRVRAAELETVAATSSQTEEKSGESDERLQLLYENIPLGYQSLDEDGNLLRVNQAWLDTLGYDRGDVIGKWFGGFLASADREDFKERFPRFKAGGRIDNVEFRMVRKDGTEIDVSYDGRIGYDTLGNFKQTHCILHDITERKRAEEALKLSEESFRRVFDDAGIPMVLGNSEGRYTRVNKAMIGLLGFSEEELLSMGIRDTTYPGDATPDDEGVRKLWTGESDGFATEKRYVHKDGHTIWGRTVVSPILGFGGEVQYLLGQTEDITERKLAEDTLRASEEKYRAIFDGALDGIVLVDAETGLVVDCNQEFERQTGRALTKLKEIHIWEIVPPEQIEMASQAFLEVQKKGVGGSSELVLRRPDGEDIPIDFTATVVEIDGRPYVQGISRDVTERKKAEEQLRRFQLGIERSRDVIFITAIDGEITYVNPAFEETYGYTPEEALGKTPRILKSGLVSQEDYEELWNNLLAKKPVVREIINKAKDGSIVTADSSANPILDEDDNIIGFLAIQRDITDRKRLEEQLRQSQLLASMGEMTAGIAHEVNNPLSAILLYSELISHVGLPSAVKRDLRVIRSEAKRASNIMRDLLTYSRKAAPVTRRQDIHRILRKVLDMRRYQQQVRNIKMSANLAPGPLRIAGNTSQLTQLLMNLIVNAEEALENLDDGRIVVTTGTDGGRVEISIADSGVGIPEGNLPQVFVPFFSTKPTGKGTGLGLATCHRIVTTLGGLIRAENNDMGGATFIVELPLVVKAK